MLVGAAPVLVHAAVFGHQREYRFVPLRASCEAQQSCPVAPVPGAKLLLVQVVFR